MSKETTIAKFFQNIELPDGTYLTSAGNGEALSYDLSGERLIDSLGRYGYRTHFTGAYVCYTCGHVCDCGAEE